MEASVPRVFDPRAVRLHRARAAGSAQAVDFLAVEAAERLADRLDVVKRDFGVALDLGCFTGALARVRLGRARAGGIGRLVSLGYTRRSPARAAPSAMRWSRISRRCRSKTARSTWC